MAHNRNTRMPSVMTDRFSQVPRADIPRSVLNRSFGHKTSFSAGLLIPFFVDEALPGDTINFRMQGFARLTTPRHPIMDNMYLETFFFSCPNRLLWDNWQKFMGEQTNPGDSTDFLVPQLLVPEPGGFETYSLADYFGLPVGIGGGTGPDYAWTVSAMPFRAYNLIYNEFFRDQNLVNSAPTITIDADSSISNYPVRRRGKRYDYFTSCLPWPQKGAPVTIPVGTTAPVVSTQNPVYMYESTQAQVGSLASKSGTHDVRMLTVSPATGDQSLRFATEQEQAGATGLQTDLTNATSITINELRQAFQIQKLLERDARGGTRYIEKIKAHFGVTSPDYRLQRPEFLGGGRTPVIVSPVAQTSSSVTGSQDPSPQGNLAAVGTVNVNGHGFMKSFTEHEWVMGILCVRADLTYQYGVERMWSRKTLYDFYFPALSNLGEQAVLQKEIFVTNNKTDNEKVFGYQERHAEYRHKLSLITGAMRSAPTGSTKSLDVWHLSEKRTAAPVLNQAFIEENPPVDRVLAVQDEPHFIFDSWSTIKHARPMPIYAVPGLIDHF